MRRVTACCTTVIFALLVAPVFVQTRSPGSNPIDLNGLWTTEDGGVVRIVQRGRSVSASFVAGDPHATCPGGGKRPTFLEGQFDGEALSGTIWRCTVSRPLIEDCGLEPVFTKPFRATVDSGGIAGTYRTEYYADSESGCKYTRDASKDSDRSFSLTRSVCDPSLWADYKRKWQTSEELFHYGSETLDEATTEFAAWKKEEAIGFIEVTVIKGGFLELIEAGEMADISLWVLKKGALVVGLASTAAWIWTDIYPHVRDHNTEVGDAQKMTRAGSDLARSALDDLKHAFEQIPACQEELDKARADEALVDEAKKLRDSWELEGSPLFRDPNDPAQNLLDAAAALKRAEQMLRSVKPPSQQGSRQTAGAVLVSLTNEVLPGGIADELGTALLEVEFTVTSMTRARASFEKQQGFVRRTEPTLGSLTERWRTPPSRFGAPASAVASARVPGDAPTVYRPVLHLARQFARLRATRGQLRAAVGQADSR